MNTEISAELSEICGIHDGDGYLRNNNHKCELDISGSIEEKEYYDKHIKSLFKTVFGIELKCRYFKHRNTYGFVVRNKHVIEFMHSLGFPYNKKSTIVEIPNIIFNSNNIGITSKFLRGLFDTDGCIIFWKRKTGSEFNKTHHYYPIVIFTTVSKKLNEKTIILLKKLGFEKIGNYITPPRQINEHPKYVIRLYGKDNTNKFFKKIGSKNPVQLSKFLVWKKIGFCQTNLTYKERLEILKKANQQENSRAYGVIRKTQRASVY